MTLFASNDSSTTVALIVIIMTQNLFSKNLTTAVKMNDNNYLLWVHLFNIFADAQWKTMHLLDNPLNKNNSIYLDQFANDYCMITQFFNSRDAKVSYGVMLLKTAKKILDTVEEVWK